MSAHPRRWLAIVVALLPCLCGFECPPPDYVLEQYHGWEDEEPWQGFDRFRNICSNRLCAGDPDCAGTRDLYRIDVDETAARDRFMFFQAPDPQVPCGDCIATAPTVCGESLFGDEGQVFRAGGAYATYEGEGEVFGHPWSMGPGWPVLVPVGHIRRIDRGACSASMSLTGGVLRETIDEALCAEIASDPHVRECSIEDAELGLYLGSFDCGVVGAADRDWFHARYVVRVTTQWATGDYVCEDILYQLDLWGRFITRRRSEYIYCPEGRCDERYLDCSTDEECHDLVPGATCNLRTSHCEIASFIDVADYGVNVRTPGAPCDPQGGFSGGAGGLCRQIRAGLNRELASLERHPYSRLYSYLLAIVEQTMWQPASLLSCTIDEDCRSFTFVDEVWTDIAYRCKTEENVCEFRPYYIFSANTYPDELELVLARDRTDTAFTFLTLLDEYGFDFCSNEGDLDTPAIGNTWVE